MSLRVSATSGSLVTLVVRNTDTAAFSYTIDTILKPVEKAPSVKTNAGELNTVHFTWVYDDSKYSGFVLTITRKQPTTLPVVHDLKVVPTPFTDASLLGNAVVTVTIKPRGWQVNFAGGFAASGLTDPAFAVVNQNVPKSGTAPDTVPAHVRPTLVDQASRRDAFNLGLAAFVHTTHTAFDLGYGIRPALTFGLGVQQTGTTYYFGPSALFSDKAALTIGIALGSIKSEPPGVRIGDSVASANILSSTGSRVTSRFFVALSYSFIGGAQASLSKPFAGGSTPATQPPAPTTPTPAAPTPNVIPDKYTADSNSTLRIVYAKALQAANVSVKWSADYLGVGLQTTDGQAAKNVDGFAWKLDGAALGGTPQTKTNDQGKLQGEVKVPTEMPDDANCHTLTLTVPADKKVNLPAGANNAIVIYVMKTTTNISACKIQP